MSEISSLVREKRTFLTLNDVKRTGFPVEHDSEIGSLCMTFYNRKKTVIAVCEVCRILSSYSVADSFPLTTSTTVDVHCTSSATYRCHVPL